MTFRIMQYSHVVSVLWLWLKRRRSWMVPSEWQWLSLPTNPTLFVSPWPVNVLSLQVFHSGVDGDARWEVSGSGVTCLCQSDFVVVLCNSAASRISNSQSSWELHFFWVLGCRARRKDLKQGSSWQDFQPFGLGASITPEHNLLKDTTWPCLRPTCSDNSGTGLVIMCS